MLRVLVTLRVLFILRVLLILRDGLSWMLELMLDVLSITVMFLIGGCGRGV